MYLPWFYILPCKYQFVQAQDVEQICWKETVQHLNFWLGVDFSPLDHAEAAKPGLLQRWTKWQMQMPKNSAKPWAPWMTLEDYPMSGRCLLVAIIRKRSETLLYTCVQDSTDARCVFQLMNLHGTFVFFGVTNGPSRFSSNGGTNGMILIIAPDSRNTISTCSCRWQWVFPKIGVPQNGWFIMENPIKLNGWFGGTIICGNTHIWRIVTSPGFSGAWNSDLKKVVDVKNV